MFTKKSFVLGAAAFALALSGTAFAESAEKLEKAHEKAEANVETMSTKEAEKLEKAHGKAEEHLEKIEAK
jgi:outer membrane lipoprotein-sorting protein